MVTDTWYSWVGSESFGALKYSLGCLRIIPRIQFGEAKTTLNQLNIKNSKVCFNFSNVDIMFHLGWYSISSICYKVRGYSSYLFTSILRPNADWRGRDHLLMVEDLLWTKKFQWRKASVQLNLTAKYTWGNFYKQNKALIAKLIPAIIP